MESAGGGVLRRAPTTLDRDQLASDLSRSVGNPRRLVAEPVEKISRKLQHLLSFRYVVQAWTPKTVEGVQPCN